MQICKNSFRVPGNAPVPSSDVSSNTGRPLTAEETEAFYNSPDGQGYLASQMSSTGGSLARREVPAELVPQRYYTPPAPVQPPMVRHDEEKPFQLQLGRLFGMKVDVDKKTRSSLASVVTGGILVAFGSIIAAKFGMKSKS